MRKIVTRNHIIGRKGVNAFEKFCLNQKPELLWKEETVNDFGIDGEVELVAINNDGKHYATGSILKVQIKSTDSTFGYIKSDTKSSFEFYAKTEDIEYWKNHKCNVLLVVYSVSDDKLYIKKLTGDDLKIQSNKKKTYPINFVKTETECSIDDTKRFDLFSQYLSQRINFDRHETISSNIFKITGLSKYLFEYETDFSSAEEIYEACKNERVPQFAFHGKKIFTFFDLKTITDFEQFKSLCIKSDKPKIINYGQIFGDRQQKNICIELVRKYLRQFFYRHRIFYNKNYHRFFFAKNEDNSDRYATYRTRVKNRDGKRKVVSFHSYIKLSFFKHFAFEIEFFSKKGIYIVINPKHLFTIDGKETLDPKKITQLTNTLTKTEYNRVLLDNIHFLFDFLA